MPSLRLVSRFDLALALGFVAVCAYARRVELRQRAPLAGGPSIGTPSTKLAVVPQVPAPAAKAPSKAPSPTTIAATTSDGGAVKPGPAQGKSTGAIASMGSVATISRATSPVTSPVTSPAGGTTVVASAPVLAQVENPQSCGSAGSPCPDAFAGAVAPTGAFASVGGSVSGEGYSFAPNGAVNVPITQFYAGMIGAPIRVGVGSPTGGDIYAEGSPTEQTAGFTPAYAFELQLTMPFAGNPALTNVTAPTVWLSNAGKTDDPRAGDPTSGDPTSDDRVNPLDDASINGHPGHPPVPSDNGQPGHPPVPTDNGHPGHPPVPTDNGHPDHPPVTAAPEPATLTMLATGIVALGSMRRRRKTIAAD